MLSFLAAGEHDVDLSHTELSSGTQITIALPNTQVSQGLVLIPDVFGLRELVDETISTLASQGIAVIAVEPFSRLSDDPSSLTRDEKLARVHELDDQQQCADVLAVAQILRSQHGCERVGLIGFCIGGMYAFKCAGPGVFDAVVSCYGMITMPDAWKGPGQKEPLEYLASNFCSPVLAIIGENDVPFAESDDVAALKKVLSNEHHSSQGSRIEIFTDCDHAFMHDPLREEHRTRDARRAWDLALTFLFAGSDPAK